LLDDLLLGDGPDPEWMVRYAENPALLGDEQRQAVEAYLASSPRARDELAVLRRFEARAMRPAPRETGRAPAPRRRWRRGLRIAIPLAIAAGAVLAVLWARIGDESRRGAEPGTPQERIARAPEVPDAPIAEAPRPPELPTARAPESPREPRAAPEAPPREGAPQPSEPAAPPQDAPIYVALLEADYAPPWDLDARPRTANVVRGDDDAPELVALAPEHVARTLSARPVLLWHLSRVPSSGGWQLVVTDPEAIDPLVQEELPRPERAGVQRVELERELAPGVEYQWSVLWRPDPGNPASDVVAQGFVRRVEAPAELRAELAARPEHERAAIYARAGLWYDALAELDRVHRRFPGEPEPGRMLARMLASAGLPQLELAGW
jgi:hypothetical protein